MKCGNKRNVPIGKHHPGKISTDRVRNRVMNVKNIQVISGNDFGHLRGQHEVVRRIFEQWIRSHLHFMKVNALAQGQPNWKGITDEVDIMAARCQLLLKLRRHNCASAISWIASYSDFHGRPKSPRPGAYVGPCSESHRD